MPMSTPVNAAQKNAQSHFARAEHPSDAFTKIQQRERVAGAANTARLRELRLAKEAAEKRAKDQLAAEHAASGRTPQRKRARPVKSVVRMSY